MTTKKHAEHPAVAAVRASGSGKVKVACSDIDGVLRGKYLHKDKFFGAVDGGLGFVGQLLRQHRSHRLAARLSRRAGAAGPGHGAARALGR
jgi:hypothetical protein